MLEPLPDTWESTRRDLHRLATHVLARRRSDLVGKIGLRPAPGGFATPAAGPENEVLRIDGGWLLRERTGPTNVTSSLDLTSASLADAAQLAGVDLGGPLDVGVDPPELGDVDAPLAVDPAAARALGDWFHLGLRVLDEVVAKLGGAGKATVAQVWPEHFDLGCDVAVGSGRANLGASPGDEGHPGPYLYVGPWTEARPGDPAYWNAPFGARLGSEALVGDPAPVAVATAFVIAGLDLLRG